MICTSITCWIFTINHLYIIYIWVMLYIKSLSSTYLSTTFSHSEKWIHQPTGGEKRGSTLVQTVNRVQATPVVTSGSCDTTWCWLLGGSPLRNCLIRAWKIVSYIIHLSKTCKTTTIYRNKTVHKRSEMCTVRYPGGTNHCRSSIAVKHKFKHLHLHTCTQIMAHAGSNSFAIDFCKSIRLQLL